MGSIPRVLLRDSTPGEEPGPIVKPGVAPVDLSIRYRIDGEIARGGMGAVLKGRDPDLGRDVALKVLREDYHNDPTMIRRFVEEAQIGGQLQHPGIVPVYELGAMNDRRPFFSMKLVKGHTLTGLLAERPNPSAYLARFLSIFESICQTMAYAHARGVIHRDLKPSNIMVGSFGEVQVMDWGLAKVLPRGGVVDDASAGRIREETVISTARSGADDDDLSQAGSILGTPSYMAPEQARGEMEAIGERADVFALGSILCEILTGFPAFTGRSAGEIQRKAARGDVADAMKRLDSCGAETELISLCRTCLASERDDRLKDASAVAHRIATYQASVQERMQAAERNRAVAEAKAIEERRRRKLQVGLAAALLLVTIVGGLSANYVLRQRAVRIAALDRAFGEITFLHEQSKEHPHEAVAWEKTLEAAIRATDQARGDAVALDRLNRLKAEIQTGLDEARRIAALRQVLVEIRSTQADLGVTRTDEAYGAAFRKAGLDLDALDPAEFAQRLKRQTKTIVVEITAFLDDWASYRRLSDRSVKDWRKPIEAARLADPDPYRDRLRVILMVENLSSEAENLKALTAAPEAAVLPAPTAVLLGWTLGNAGKTEEAIALLRSAVIRDPSDIWANYYLGQVLENRRPPAREEAIWYYTAARSLRPETAHRLGHLLKAVGRPSEAEAVFRDLVKRSPANMNDLGCLVQFLKATGRDAEGETTLNRGIANYREIVQRQQLVSPEWHNQLGYILQQHNKLDEAETAFREVIRLKPDLAEAHHNLATVLINLNKHEEAVVAFREAIRLKPDFAEAHHFLGSTFINLRKFEEAAVSYREAIRLKPDYAQAHTNLGGVLVSLNKPDEALASYREAIRIDPNYVPAYINFANTLNRLKRLDEAVVAWRQVIHLSPDDAEAHQILGAVLFDLAGHEEAAAAFREAIRLKPDYADAHQNLGNALYHLGEFEESAASSREAARISPGDFDAWASLGNALLQLRKFDEATAAYREAVRIYPEFTPNYNLALALRYADKFDEAAIAYREAIRFKPDFADAHNSLGDTLYQLGKYNEAVASYREAVRLKPDYADGHYNLGFTLRVLGRLDEAIDACREAIRRDPNHINAHYGLASVLTMKGDFADALPMYRKGHELGSRQLGWTNPWKELEEAAEKHVPLASRFPDILSGKAAPKNNEEKVVFAQMAFFTAHYAVAARLWSEAIAADPSLVAASQNRFLYEAASAAALAASGQGKDQLSPNDETKAMLRKQALDWSKAELEFKSKQLQSEPKTREKVLSNMRSWQRDINFISVRDVGLEKLPKAEQTVWKAFWGEAEALRKRAENLSP